MRRPETINLPTSDIEIGERLRPADAVAVEAMIHSIQSRGLLSPVQVLAVKSGYRLLDGLQRLSAAMLMGMPEIPATVHRCSVREGMNIEVEANLARASLTPLDLGLFLARQKELYEGEHPETRKGHYERGGNPDDITGKTPVMSFAVNAAEALGKDETTVRRLIAAAKSLTKDEVQQLRSAPQKVRLNDLQTLAKCGEASDRALVCEALSKGTAKSAKEALKTAHAQPGDALAPKSRAQKLNDAWARTGKKERRAFVRDFREEIEALLAEIDGAAEGGAT